MYYIFYRSKISIFFLLIFISHLLFSTQTITVQAASSSRIHYLTLPDNTEAILLECNGQFGMVDSGEDNDFPDGSNPAYPLRSGIIKGNGYENEVINYLHSVGVTSENFEFYIGTHPHSDHIGSADEVIRTFHPKRVYIQEYKDSYISSTNNLWDNLYVYDNMLAAANEVGATIIQNFSPNVPLYPEKISMKGSIIWDDQGNIDGSRPSELTLTLYNPETAENQFFTITSADAESWSYNIENLQKYDDTKTPIAYQITLSVPDSYTVTTLNNGFDFICSHSPISETPVDDMENVPYSVMPDSLKATDEQISESLLYSEGGIYNSPPSEENSNISTSDEMETSSIPASDQVDASCLLDPNNISSLEDTEEGAKEGQFENLDDSLYTTSTPVFTLGNDMKIQIKHYGGDYKTSPKPDANYFSLGVLVECNGKSAFLAGDINNYEGAETALSLDLGHVDILTLGHHGYYGSNTYGYVTGLAPQVMICAGKCSSISNLSNPASEFGTLDTFLMMGKNGTPLYATAWYHDLIDALVFNFDETLSNNIPKNTSFIAVGKEIDSTEYIYYLDGFPTPYTGWIEFNQQKHYFENSIYSAKNQWIFENNSWYYLDPNGIVSTGWQKINSKWYYLDSNGIMLTGWQKINSKWYYLNSSGAMLTSWQWINNKWYYFNSSGIMLTGWQWINNKWYYLNSSGAMLTGWQRINNKWYYLNSSGAMLTGWQRINNKWYYLNSSGAMLTGWQKINGKYYYMFSSGAMASNTRIEGYYVDSSGAWIPGR